MFNKKPLRITNLSKLRPYKNFIFAVILLGLSLQYIAVLFNGENNLSQNITVYDCYLPLVYVPTYITKAFVHGDLTKEVYRKTTSQICCFRENNFSNL